jgi:hypothetical protein
VSERGERGEERRREAKEDSSGTGDDGGQKTSKTEAREPDSSSAFALPCPTRLASPLLVFVFASPRLASPRLVCACQLATRRQTRPSLSFVLMPTRLHASTVFLVVVFLFTLANLNPGPSLSRRFGLVFRCHALAREPFRSPAAPRLVRTRVRTQQKRFDEISSLYNSLTFNF